MTDEKRFLSNVLAATIRIGILILLAAWCFEIVKPFNRGESAEMSFGSVSMPPDASGCRAVA